MATKKTIEQFREDVKNIWGDKYIVPPDAVYLGNHEKIKIVCPKHGEFFVEVNSFLHKHGCKECRRETVNKDRVLSQEEAIKRIKDVWGDKYDLSEVKYVNARTKITPICPIHGKFKARYSDFVNGCGCPLCRESKLERELSDFFNKENIQFNVFEKPTWLKNGGGQLSLDFYLPDYNAAVECQGKQHYTQESYYCKNGEFEKIQNRDHRKLQLCQ